MRLDSKRGRREIVWQKINSFAPNDAANLDRIRGVRLILGVRAPPLNSVGTEFLPMSTRQRCNVVGSQVANRHNLRI